MALRMAIAGPPNTGKSYAWHTYERGEEIFAICPSSKHLFFRHSDGTKPSALNVFIKKAGKTAHEIAADPTTSTNSVHDVIAGILIKNLDRDEIEVSGDYAQCSEVKYVASYKKFVNKYLPEKKIILTTDFTHYISYQVQHPFFRKRNKGGEAFARFWDLAADTLSNTILSADLLREDMIDVTEFHVDWNEDLEVFKFNVPFGKMLSEKFQPETYFDIVLYSTVLPYEEQSDEAERFKFVTVKRDGMDGRSMNLFADVAKAGMIPNDMQLVMERVNHLL